MLKAMLFFGLDSFLDSGLAQLYSTQMAHVSLQKYHHSNKAALI